MLDIFDPRHYEGVRRPLLDAVSLPPWCYTSDAFYRREVEEILVKSWHLVGRTDEIPNPGDYRVFPVFRESCVLLDAGLPLGQACSNGLDCAQLAVGGKQLFGRHPVLLCEALQN